MNLIKTLPQYSKAIAPVLVGLLLYVLSQFGVTADMKVGDLAEYAVVAAIVYLVPNKKAGEK